MILPLEERTMRRNSGLLFVIASILVTLTTTLNALAQSTSDGSSSGGSAGASIVCLLLQCFIPLVIWGIWIAVSVWVKNDAEAAGVDNPMLWAVLTFFFGIVVLIIYLVAIKPNALKNKPQYSAPTGYMDESNKKPGSCIHCGYNAGTTVGRCPKCGSNLS